MSIASHFDFCLFPDLTRDAARRVETVRDALDAAARVLDTTRNLQLPDDNGVRQHTYEDKFGLVEFMTNTAVGSYVVALEKMGLTQDELRTLLQWHRRDNLAATLRWESSVTADFVKEAKVDVVRSEATIDESGILNGRFQRKVKVTDVRNEYHWNVTSTYQLSVFGGTGSSGDDEQGRVRTLRTRTASATVITTAKQSPARNFSPAVVADVKLTWLLEHLGLSDDDKDDSSGSGTKTKFSIDRLSKSCRTPRRNSEVFAALKFARDLAGWSYRVGDHLKGTVDKLIPEQPVIREEEGGATDLDNIVNERRLGKIMLEGIFHPIVPLMENGTVLRHEDAALFLQEQERTIDEAIQKWNKLFHDASTSPSKLVSSAEAEVTLLTRHLKELAQQ